MSDINSLRAELSRQESINSELRSELNELYAGISQAENEMSRFQNYVSDTLSGSTQRMNNSHVRIVQAYEIQGEIDKLYVRFKNMELANKKIRECTNKKYYEFANYRTVRKIVQGIMDNMNVNMVSDQVIYKSVEKQHLQTPDYWLTCVLLSIMAWKNDDRQLAERAIERAVRLDKKNSSIFYMLFNIRVGREAAALKWFSVYQECELKGSDERTFLLLFSLLSKTVDELVDEHTKYEIYNFINKVIAMNARAEGFSEDQVTDMIRHHLEMMSEEDMLKLQLLKKCCDDYADIARTVILAQNNMNILQFILDVANVSEVERNEYLSAFIDEEIAKPNTVETDVYEEIRYNEIIIACDGDMERAEQLYTAEKEKKEKELNLIEEMIHWVYDKSSTEVSGQIRKNMFSLTASLQKKAVEKYIEVYRGRVKKTHPITLGEYKTTADFTNLPAEQEKVTEFYHRQRDEALSQVKNLWMIIGIVIAVLGAAGTLYAGYALMAVTAAGLLMTGYVLISNSRRRKQIISTCELNINNKKELLSRLFAEYQELGKIYQEYDAYSEQIRQALKQF